MSYYRLLIFFTFLSSCSHVSNQVEEVATGLNLKGSADDDGVSVDRHSRLLSQTQEEIDHELRGVIWLNSQILFEAKYLLARLSSCFIQKKEDLLDEEFLTLDLSVLNYYKKEGKNSSLRRNELSNSMKKETIIGRLELEISLRKRLLNLKKSVKVQLYRCEDLGF